MTRVESKAMLKAPPKLEWTGERFLPWIRNATMAYEHLHRYAFAAQYAKGCRVLDLGSGEGYGASILAKSALSVLGVDIDPEAIEHASVTYRKDNLEFRVGSFADVPIYEDHSFDLVVCFEGIEHIRDHHQLLCEVKRLLKPDGLFMVSTPNKSAYHAASMNDNQFHVSELEPDELRQLLRRYFHETTFLGQRIHPGSSIWPLESCHTGPIEELTMERDGGDFQFIPNDKRVPVYIIALASDSLGALNANGSVLIDTSNELLNEIESTVRTVLKIKETNEAVVSLRKDLDWHVRKLDDASQMVMTRTSQLQRTQDRLSIATEELDLIHGSKIWKILHTCWKIRDTLLPAGTLRRQLLQNFSSMITPHPGRKTR